MKRYFHVETMKEPRAIDTKSKVSTRANLSDRVAPTTLEPLRTKGKRSIEDTTYTAATATSFVTCAKDIPPRHHEPQSTQTLAVRFNGTSTLRESTHSGIGERDASFFSRVRAEERKDDSVRHGLDTIPTRSGASKMQRTVDIMRRREHDPQFEPKREEYAAIERRPPNGVPPPTKLESVRFTYTMPKSSQQLDYRTPIGQIPMDLSQQYGPQRRVISESASSKDLFYATTKSRSEVLPGYMSHVPADEKTLATMHGSDDVLRQFAQSGHMSAAKPGSIANPMPERSPQAKLASTQGFYAEQALSSPSERSLNRIKCGKKTAVLN